MQLYLHLPICLHGEHKDTVTFIFMFKFTFTLILNIIELPVGENFTNFLVITFPHSLY
jgi:hypothetical protein